MIEIDMTNTTSSEIIGLFKSSKFFTIEILIWNLAPIAQSNGEFPWLLDLLKLEIYLSLTTEGRLFFSLKHGWRWFWAKIFLQPLFNFTMSLKPTALAHLI